MSQWTAVRPLTWLVALLLVTGLQAEQAPAGKADAGRVVWRHMCSFCHGVTGEGGWGPDLAGRALTLAQFTRAIRQPWGLMPVYTLTVGNLGRPNGPAVEDLTIFVRIPAGASLYVAGESPGGFAQHGLGRATVFGRIAGRDAALNGGKT